MLSNNEKTAYLNALFGTLFVTSESKYMDSLAEIIRQININDTPKGQELDEYAAAPVMYNQEKIEHPGIVHHNKPAERHKYRKPVVVKTPRLKEELGDLMLRYNIFIRRKKSIIAFTKRMLWTCNNFADIQVIEPEQFRNLFVHRVATVNLENKKIEYATTPTIEKDKVEKFLAKEAEAINKIDQHILIEQLTG